MLCKMDGILPAGGSMLGSVGFHVVSGYGRSPWVSSVWEGSPWESVPWFHVGYQLPVYGRGHQPWSSMLGSMLVSIFQGMGEVMMGKVPWGSMLGSMLDSSFQCMGEVVLGFMLVFSFQDMGEVIWERYRVGPCWFPCKVRVL